LHRQNRCGLGVGSDVIAKWVGNTPSVIKKHYLGNMATEYVKPLE
jgi:hypothetical protein